MKDEALLRRAQAYMDALSVGKNPLTGEQVPEGDVAAEERLQKCFAYVARVLDAVIGDPTVMEAKMMPVHELQVRGERRPHRSKFYAECVELADFPYRDGPMTVAEFTRLVNGQISAPTQRRLPNQRVYQWLVSVGILTRSEDGVYSVTEEGVDIGFSTVPITDQYGSRIGVQANREGQSFLVDNIEAISEYRNRK